MLANVMGTPPSSILLLDTSTPYFTEFSHPKSSDTRFFMVPNQSGIVPATHDQLVYNVVDRFTSQRIIRYLEGVQPTAGGKIRNSSCEVILTEKDSLETWTVDHGGDLTDVR
jgi:hypothetical protein